MTVIQVIVAAKPRSSKLTFLIKMKGLKMKGKILLPENSLILVLGRGCENDCALDLLVDLDVDRLIDFRTSDGGKGGGSGGDVK